MPSFRIQLEEADRLIEQTHERIAAQVGLIERLKKDGHATLAAERLLATFLHLLDSFTRHRADLIEEGRLEGIGLPQTPSAR